MAWITLLILGIIVLHALRWRRNIQMVHRKLGQDISNLYSPNAVIALCMVIGFIYTLAALLVAAAEPRVGVWELPWLWLGALLTLIAAGAGGGD